MKPSGKSLDDLSKQLSTTDNKIKLTLAANMITYLSDPENSMECEDIGIFIDVMTQWCQSSNNKISQCAIDVLTHLVDRMGTDFKPYAQSVLSTVIDRLGDNKEVVREKAQLFLLKLMERDVVSPPNLFEKLGPAFSHKNGKIREEALMCVQATMREYGAVSLGVSKQIGSILKLLNDPTPNVRDTAFNTIVEIYRHVGEKLRVHLQKKSVINPQKLQALMARFDEIRDAGDMLPSAVDASPLARMKDETDNAAGAIPKSGRPRLGSLTKRSASTSKDTNVSGVPASGSKPCRASSLKRPTPTNASAQAGGVDEDAFVRVFDDVPNVQLYSVREMEDQLSSIRDTINDSNKDWSKRVDALKKLRSLIIAGAAKYEEFHTHLRLLEQPFQVAVRDLRSQVVREACVSIAYLSQELGNKLDHFSEVILSSLINLIPNSAKIMASSGYVTIRFILRNTHHARLIPIITSNLTSKSKDIRRACCEFIELILQCWSVHLLERQLPSLQEALKKGISDADPDARIYSRKAYWTFKSHFPDNAEQLLNSLDSSYRKALNWDLGMSNSSSTNSLNQQSSVNSRLPSASSSGKSHLLSAPGSTENLHQSGVTLHRAPSLTRHHRSGIPVLQSSGPKSGDADVSNRRGSSSRALTKVRSNSAIDLQAAQRAKARAQYAALARHKVGSGASLPRPVQKAPSPVSSAVTSPERLGRTRNRPTNISQSQPTSRSGSPSSRLSYATYVARDIDGRRRPTGIPVSTGTSRDASRETSPNRFLAGPSGSKLGSFRNRPAHLVNQSERQTHARPVMAQKILQQSREAETALADALTSDSIDSGEINKRSMIGRKSYRSFEEHSDDSETSSVCSERSYDSFRRSSENINDIIHNCGSILWNERKDGLVSLQTYLQNGNHLNWPELKQVMEIFTKMFMDSHTKVFSLFIDALNELILAHKEDLNDWLFILLTRLFNKLGTDLLGSIQTKLYKTLNIVRESFSLELQMNAVIRFLIDQTQTPNSKVKIAVLLYLVQIATYMEPSAFNPGIDEAVSAIAKVMTWYQTAKNPEVKKAAQNAIIGLFNLNTPQVTMILSQLPPEYQEAAATVVHSHLRRSSTESTPPSPSPHLQSPGTPQSLNQASIDIFDDPLNPEDVYRSLHRTTAEIQNYSFDGSLSTGKPLDKERDTTSQDSGISQMLGERRETLEERINQLFVFSKDFLSDIIKKKEQGSQLHKTETTCNKDNDVPSQGAAYNEEREVLFTVFEALQLEKGELKTSVQDCKKALTNVRQMIKNGSVSAVIDMFKDLLKSLLYILATNENRLKSTALGVLTEMFSNRKVCAHFGNFVELMVLRVLSSYSDPNKEISRAAEQCALAIGANLSATHLIGVLCPLIKTGEFPINLAAVKILTKVMESNAREVIEPNVDHIMSVLLQAYDHPESSVRKSAVFCMVALHSVVGEEILQPYLANMSASKLKLLNLYIKRSHPDFSGGCGGNV